MCIVLVQLGTRDFPSISHLSTQFPRNPDGPLPFLSLRSPLPTLFQALFLLPCPGEHGDSAHCVLRTQEEDWNLMLWGEGWRVRTVDFSRGQDQGTRNAKVRGQRQQHEQSHGGQTLWDV